MSAPSVGDPAPSLRLPSGQGPEIGLDDYRGRKNVVVWFTKGMLCPFCRAQMTRLARAYPEIQKRDAEILEVSLSTPTQAKAYTSKFPIPFPYLADSDYAARKQWGVDVRSHGPIYYAKQMVAGMTSKFPENDYGTFRPTPAEMPKAMADDDMGLFVVDKQGVVRFAFTGTYMMSRREDRPLPSNDEIVAALARCA